jgi:hypothetical protein
MITLAVAKWSITLVHGCPITGFFLEEANQHNFYMDLIALHNRNLIEEVGYEGEAHTELSNTNEEYVIWICQAFETCPCLRVDLMPNGEIMGYIREVDRNHAKSRMLDNPKILLALLDILKVPTVASKIVDFLRVKDAASLGSTSKVARGAIGYDPFNGMNKKAMLGSSKYLSSGDRRISIEALALYAFNHIYDVIQPHVKRGSFTRPGDRDVLALSKATKYGPKQNALLWTNCLATTTTSDGTSEGAVNFVYSDWRSGRNGLLDNPQLHLNSGDYAVTEKMHGELRLMQRQHDRGIFRPIFVDKYCCPFCAVQFIVMGLIQYTPGAINNTLAWYTFSPYLIYFKSRRVRMWGADVEERFARLNPDEKLYFLFKLATSCSLTKYVVKVPMYAIEL